MMKKVKACIAAILVMSLIIGTNVFASTTTVYCAKKQTWTKAGSMPRTGDFSFVFIWADSVYPNSGKDTYKKIQAVLENSKGTHISSIITLTEGDYSSELYIKDGYLSNKTVYAYFRGNNPDYAAYADVSYYSN